MIGTMKATPLKMRDSEHEGNGKDANEGAGCFKCNQCGMKFETLRQRSFLMGAQTSTSGSLTPRPNTGGKGAQNHFLSGDQDIMGQFGQLKFSGQRQR